MAYEIRNDPMRKLLTSSIFTSSVPLKTTAFMVFDMMNCSVRRGAQQSSRLSDMQLFKLSRSRARKKVASCQIIVNVRTEGTIVVAATKCGVGTPAMWGGAGMRLQIPHFVLIMDMRLEHVTWLSRYQSRRMAAADVKVAAWMVEYG